MTVGDDGGRGEEDEYYSRKLFAFSDAIYPVCVCVCRVLRYAHTHTLTHTHPHTPDGPSYVRAHTHNSSPLRSNMFYAYIV